MIGVASHLADIINLSNDKLQANPFPPVATPKYMFSGVLDLTDLKTGSLMVNPITKANCSRENGWVPANGLIYTTPKHCTCWPILRGYVALAARARAPDRDVGRPVDQIHFPLEKGPAYGSRVPPVLLQNILLMIWPGPPGPLGASPPGTRPQIHPGPPARGA